MDTFDTQPGFPTLSPSPSPNLFNGKYLTLLEERDQTICALYNQLTAAQRQVGQLDVVLSLIAEAMVAKMPVDEYVAMKQREANTTLERLDQRKQDLEVPTNAVYEATIAPTRSALSLAEDEVENREREVERLETLLDEAEVALGQAKESCEEAMRSFTLRLREAASAREAALKPLEDLQRSREPILAAKMHYQTTLWLLMRLAGLPQSTLEIVSESAPGTLDS